MTRHNTLIVQKKQLRQRLKQLRASIPEHTREIYSNRITQQVLELAEIKAAKTIFAFISWSSEVYTHDLIRWLIQQKKNIVVPKILDKETMIAQRLDSWDDLISDKLGILAPAKAEKFEGPVDVILTPGLGFTEQGHRIGFGAGYYDRWFASHDAGVKIAIAFEIQIVDQLPLEVTDIPVDMIITEERIIRL